MLVQSFAVYSLLTALMLLVAWQASRSRSWGMMVLAILAYAVVFGYRYGVGRDYFIYLNMFETIRDGRILYRPCEWGFLQLIALLCNLGYDTTVYFAVTSFIPVYLAFRVFKDEPRLYVPVVAVFMLYAFWQPTANLVRQCFAVGLFALAVNAIYKRQWLSYYLLVALAFIFHKSALVLVLVYPIFALNRFKPFFNNVIAQIVLFVLAFGLMQLNVLELLVKVFFNIIVLMGYADSAAFENYTFTHTSLGLGFAIRMAVNLMIICHSNEIKAYFKDSPVAIFYDIWFVGVVLGIIFVQSMSVMRMLLYCTQIAIFVMAYALEYFRCNDRQYYYLMLVFMLLTFAATILAGDVNTSSYIFNWQEDKFYLKDEFKAL